MDDARRLNHLATEDAVLSLKAENRDSDRDPIPTFNEVRMTVGPLVSPQDPETYTVNEFCRRHSMSRSYFYEVLIPAGAAPAMTMLGRHRSITREAAAAWRAQWTGRTLPSRPKRPTEIT